MNLLWRRLAASVAAIAGLLILVAPSAWANTYGSGNFGDCNYNQGCSTSSSTTSSSTSSASTSASSSTSAASNAINLDDYGTTSIDAYVLTITQGKSYSFTFIDSEGFVSSHSFYVDKITSNSATITFHSSSQTVDFKLDQQRFMDLASEGQSYIGAMITALSPPNATLRIWRAANSAISKPSPTKSLTAATTSATQPGGGIANWLKGILAFGALALSILGFVGTHKH